MRSVLLEVRVRPVLSAMSRLARRIVVALRLDARSRESRRAIVALNTADDFLLLDMGIRRDEIERAVRQGRFDLEPSRRPRSRD
jgi:uncharacterized protein YjiS (DUF1127 family)